MYFLDTNILLNYTDELSSIDKFYISSVSLEELESIKTNRNKTEDLRYQARNAVKWIVEHQDKCIVVHYFTDYDQVITNNSLEITPDTKIIACALTVKDSEFITDDVLCGLIAKHIFGLKVSLFSHNVDNYTGFKELIFTDDDMAKLYQNPTDNIAECLVNQYLIVKNTSGETVDTLRWDGEKYSAINKKTVKSSYFEKLKPKDVYQSCVIDSLLNNTITAISGKAGSGKSLLSIMVAMNLIESGKASRIIIMFNPTKARGAADMGFYTGSALEKALQSSIGQMLTTKFGDRFAVDLLIQQEKIKLVSMADVRGMEVMDGEILYITEAQNTSVDLIKLCLSRVSSGAKVIIEGDYESQVDSFIFEGKNNGLKRIIDAFKNHEEFGYIQLQNVWRSKIAELCELL